MYLTTRMSARLVRMKQMHWAVVETLSDTDDDDPFYTPEQGILRSLVSHVPVLCEPSTGNPEGA